MDLGLTGSTAVVTNYVKSRSDLMVNALRRAEDPDRDDINVLLPIAWDSRSRVVRVTFSRPTPEEPTE